MKANILPIVGSLIGALMYLAVTAAVLIKGYKPPKPPGDEIVKRLSNNLVNEIVINFVKIGRSGEIGRSGKIGRSGEIGRIGSSGEILIKF